MPTNWNLGAGSPQVFDPLAGLSREEYNQLRRSGIARPRSFTNANPWTQGWMSAVGNEQNQLMQMLFGGGGAGAGMLSQFMNPMSSGGFMNQFISSAAPALQGVTRSASEAEMGRAQTLGREGQEGASAGFSNLGSKYSGANLLAGNKAYQDAMGDLSGKIASENFGLQ